VSLSNYYAWRLKACSCIKQTISTNWRSCVLASGIHVGEFLLSIFGNTTIKTINRLLSQTIFEIRKRYHCCIRWNSHCLQFLNDLNNPHQNIKFITEKSNGTFPFLDVEIKISGANFDFQIYKKKSTNTGALLNFLAFCPSNWNICFSNKSFWLEVKNSKDMFHENGYSTEFFDKMVQMWNKRGKNTV